MKGKRWNGAVDMFARRTDLRLSQLRFLSSRMEIKGRLREEVDVGSRTLDPVHNSGPSLVE